MADDVVFYGGCVLSPEDARDYKARDFVAMGIRPAEYMPEKKAPVLYQGSVGSCVAHAIATMKWYHERREKKSEEKYSTDYIYHNRLPNDWQGHGMITREALSQLCKCGTCYYSHLSTNTEYPSAEVKRFISPLAEEAKKQVVKSYVRCYNDDEICECVYQHGAALISLEITSSFDAFVLRNDSNMILSIPKNERVRGYHCVCAMGYTKDGIVIQNSWGDTWGNKGFAILPWGYPIREAWSVVDVVKQWDMIELTVDSKDAYINGKKTELDVPAKVINGRTMVPIRFVAEALGCEVEYLNDARKVIIRRASNGGNN